MRVLARFFAPIDEAVNYQFYFRVQTRARANPAFPRGCDPLLSDFFAKPLGQCLTPSQGFIKTFGLSAYAWPRVFALRIR